MRYNPDSHHRRSIRLREYDYSAAGAYSLTICVQGRQCLFGRIVDGAMRLNGAGEMVETWWRELHDRFPLVSLDAHIVMPNHFHGVLFLVGAPLCGCPVDAHSVGADPCVCPPLTVGEGGHKSEGGHAVKGGHAGPPLHRVVQCFKTMTTNAYIHGVNEHNWSPFPGRLWQRNYYERIIRHDQELAAIRQYIAANPARWADDKENPDSIAAELPIS